MRSIVFGVLALIVLSGCAQPEATEDVAAVAGPMDDANWTALPAPPTASLVVDVDNGTAPLRVNFTIDGTNATTWAFVFGDGNATNGTQFPATINHTYFAGLHNFSLMVAGANGTTWQNGTVNVTALEAVPEIVLEPFSKTVSVDQPCVGCKAGTSTCTWRVHGNGEAQDCAWIEFGPDYAGMPFTITGTGLDPDGLFWETCDSGPGARFDVELSDESGLVPAGATCILVWEAFDPIVTVTFDITVA